MPNAFLCAKAVARMIAHEDPYAEGKEKNTVTFLQMFLPDRFTTSTTTPSAKTIEKLLDQVPRATPMANIC